MADRVERIVRQKIHDSIYFKTKCDRINAADFCDRAVDLTSIGGLINSRPSQFLCLVYKLTLISPSAEIVTEMLKQPYFKYLSALAAFYIRLVYNPVYVHELLEPLYADYRKLRLVDRNNCQKIVHMDEYIDALLTSERYLDLLLPNMPSRAKLVEIGLDPRPNLLA